MDLYTKIYEIMNRERIPVLPTNNNLEDLCCYYLSTHFF